MAGKQKKGKKGNAPKYITRNQALTRLQITLPEFRRLCILKGIHPREPKKKTQGGHKTYYHVKDVDFLAHEPLLAISREIKAHEKKVRRARMRQEQELAQRLEAMKPSYALDHLVKERYPAFVDALRDLDDALTLVHLFAVLPADKSLGIPVQRVLASRRLSLEWQAFVTRTHALRKVFVSVKGIYFQAEVVGQSITWIVPHVLSQVIPTDVDFRVMLTFLEFYQTLLSFVNFKLYHELGLPYPPVLDARLEEAAAELYEVMRQLAGRRKGQGEGEGRGVAQIAPGEEKGEGAAPLSGGASEAEVRDPQGAEDTDEAGARGGGSGPETGEAEQRQMQQLREQRQMQQLSEQEASARMAALQQRLQTLGALQSGSRAGSDGSAEAQEGGFEAAEAEEDAEDDEESAECRKLFRGLVFFLSREVPREPLLFIIRSFGGSASWDGDEAPLPKSDESITHEVVDRPQQQKRIFSRQYVQPQWLFDSVNARLQLPTDPYAPGRAPPPHLSPFVNNEEEGYKPDYALVIERLKAATASAQHKGAQQALGGSERDMVLLLEGAEKEVESQAQLQALLSTRTEEQAAARKAADIEEQERQFATELAQELAGVPFSAAAAAAPADPTRAEEAAGEGEGRDEGGSGAAVSRPSPLSRPKRKQGRTQDSGTAYRTQQGEEEEEEEQEGDSEEAEQGEEVEDDEEGSHAVLVEAPGEDEEVEAREMARLMMPRKTQKLYEAMQIGKARKKAAVAQIMARKKEQLRKRAKLS